MFRIFTGIYAIFCLALAALCAVDAFTTMRGQGWTVYYTILGLIDLGFSIWAVRMIVEDAKDEREHEEWMRKFTAGWSDE